MPEVISNSINGAWTFNAVLLMLHHICINHLFSLMWHDHMRRFLEQRTKLMLPLCVSRIFFGRTLFYLNWHRTLPHVFCLLYQSGKESSESMRSIPKYVINLMHCCSALSIIMRQTKSLVTHIIHIIIPYANPKLYTITNWYFSKLCNTLYKELCYKLCWVSRSNNLRSLF